MDRVKLVELLRKYRYALLVLLLGLILMGIPRQKAPEATPTTEPPVQDFSHSLEEILGSIQGVGRVRVLLTQSSGEETVYQTDPGTGENLDTVILSRGSGQQEGLVRQVNPPEYLGALVVCQGGDSPTVRLQVAEAVSRVTGLGMDRISVMKMD